VDEKTYEYSMLRALGLKENSVIVMVLVESFIFSVPALLLSFVIAYLINIITLTVIFYKISLARTYFLHPIGFVYVKLGKRRVRRVWRLES
jgi:ABC-type antimicrobial peptide transport system permease subunit